MLCVSGSLADRSELDSGTKVVGVPTDSYLNHADPEGRGRQEQSNWGWAAVLQQILNYHGVQVTQTTLVTRVLGEPKNEVVTPERIVKAVPGYYVSGDKQVKVVLDDGGLKTSQALDDLERNWPLLVGLKGEENILAYAWVGAYYEGDKHSAEITRVILRDPDPSLPSRIEMSGSEFRKRLAAIVRLYVER